MLWGGGEIMYEDEIAKIDSYKKRIIELMAKNGEFPNSIDVQKRMKDIDTKLAIFQFRRVASGTTFDTKQFNQYMQDIKEDLVILYHLAYKHCIEEYEQVKSYIDTHLREMEGMARHYAYKTNLELNSTGLGKTIFLQTDGFNVDSGNTIRTVHLGPVIAHAGAKLACICNGTDFYQKQVVFSFGKAGNCAAYGYNGDMFQVEGEPICHTYKYANSEIDDASEVVMDIKELHPNTSLDYVIYAGQDRFQLENEKGTPSYISKVNKHVVADKAGDISFYIVGGTYAKFIFIREPDSRNFTGERLNNIDKHQHIFMNFEKGVDFTIDTDGTIYADKVRGIVRSGKLYYPSATGLQSFFIEEYEYSNEVSYDDVTVTISSVKTGAPLYLSAIAIKELYYVEVDAS